MDLQVIGAAFGRIGTLSTKVALEQLGYGPCYHMIEVFARPGHSAAWHAVALGQPVDLDPIFEGFRSTVDWPSCNAWRRLWEANPGSKVLLNRRLPEAWYESLRNTIVASLDRPVPPDAPPGAAEHRAMGRDLVWGTFDGRVYDRDHVLAVLAAHEADVVASVPADDLLVFDVAEGWAPLCAFLDVPVPDQPFPRVNDTPEFRARSGLDA
jgi:hypothetical protein